MKNFILLALILILTGCGGAPGKDGKNGSNGTSGSNGSNGNNGSNGSNGHSIVAKSRIATASECSSSLGTAVDLFLDLDDSLNYSAGDTVQAGVVACNGSNGTNGTNGTSGTNGTPGAPGTSATMVAYSLSDATQCVQVAPSIWAKRMGNDQAQLFSGNVCDPVDQINTGNNAFQGDINEVYISGTTMFILQGVGGLMTIRKLVYQ